MRAGGPGSLVVYKDSAVVLEKAGKIDPRGEEGLRHAGGF